MRPDAFPNRWPFGTDPFRASSIGPNTLRDRRGTMQAWSSCVSLLLSSSGSRPSSRRTIGLAQSRVSPLPCPSVRARTSHLRCDVFPYAFKSAFSLDTHVARPHNAHLTFLERSIGTPARQNSPPNESSSLAFIPTGFGVTTSPHRSALSAAAQSAPNATRSADPAGPNSARSGMCST